MRCRRVGLGSTRCCVDTRPRAPRGATHAYSVWPGARGEWGESRGDGEEACGGREVVGRTRGQRARPAQRPKGCVPRGVREKDSGRRRAFALLGASLRGDEPGDEPLAARWCWGSEVRVRECGLVRELARGACGRGVWARRASHVTLRSPEARATGLLRTRVACARRVSIGEHSRLRAGEQRGKRGQADWRCGARADTWGRRCTASTADFERVQVERRWARHLCPVGAGIQQNMS